ADEASHLIVKQIKPNFKTLGSRLGKDMKTVGTTISGLNAEQISQLEKDGKMMIEGYEITTADVEILTKDIPGWTVASEGKITVALDLTLTDELKAEGVAREFVNRVQNIRKDNNFDLTDRIIVQIEHNSGFDEQLLQNKAYISEEVLSDKIEIVNSLANFAEIEIDDVRFKINVEKV